ncbi:hypothetical protein CYY_007065 [Polysphondylium violaceum]|uniref:DUF4922 domain-containing protein n=1 Tax=Polysphondylium violaceum TaxID=133409 RepID=A0A8J4PQZ5_9MYCE|nr:hypothetical protein CYY_007065 [Polysphondylium violaceum]
MDSICINNKNKTQDQVQKDIENIIIENKHDKVKAWRESFKYLYNISTSLGYINESRLALNVPFPKFYNHSYTNVGFEININCSKPEIVAGVKTLAENYLNYEGKCVICFENIGSSKRDGLRAFEFNIGDTKYFRHFPPYPYFSNHNIIVDKNHVDQKLDHTTIRHLLELCDMLPGYKVASNSDKFGTGCTNLLHRHFQAGDHPFPVFDAVAKKEYRGQYQESSLFSIDWLHYPCCCLRVVSRDRDTVEYVINQLFSGWRETGDYPTLARDNQTFSMITQYNVDKGAYEFLLFPRHADLSRFVARPTLQCIKKEFVGIFEFSGVAILPGRLKEQLEQLESILESQSKSWPNTLAELVDGGTKYLSLTDSLEMFRDWLHSFFFTYYFNQSNANNNTIKQLLTLSVQNTFIEVLADNSPISENDSALLESWISQSNLNKLFI